MSQLLLRIQRTHPGDVPVRPHDAQAPRAVDGAQAEHITTLGVGAVARFLVEQPERARWDYRDRRRRPRRSVLSALTEDDEQGDPVRLVEETAG